MFKELKRKLILFNLGIMTVVLALIFSGIYVFMQQGQLRERNMRLTEMIQKQKNEPPFKDKMHGGGPGGANSGKEELVKPDMQDSPDKRIAPNTFFVRLSSNGDLINTSWLPNISQDEAVEMAKNVFSGEEKSGTMTYRSSPIAYMKDDINGNVIVAFMDNSEASATMTRLIWASVAIGLLSLLIAYFASRILAERALVPVKTAWQKQLDFVGDASHELRTPIAALTSTLDVVLESPEETVESQSHWLGNIQKELARMRKLVEDLLFLARADSPGEELMMTKTALSPLITDTMALLRPMADHKKLTLNAAISPGVTVLGNDSRLRQLVTILLDNAIKYTPADGHIDIALNYESPSAVLTVTDSGEGIGAEHLEKIFDRFYRIEKARSRNSGGSGLGLAIARCIVDEHKGKLVAESEPGQGTTFRVTFPA